jgi:hypothetical protein
MRCFGGPDKQMRSKVQGCKNAGGVSRGRRNQPRRTELWRRQTAVERIQSYAKLLVLKVIVVC